MRLSAIFFCIGFGGAAMASSAHASIVNYDATNPAGTTIILAAGTYQVQLIGTAAGGAYDAWDPWSGGTVSGCDGTGANCAQGWTDRFTISFNGNTTQYLLPSSSYFSTATQALTAYTTSPLDQQVNGGLSTPAPNPITFSLAAATPVTFGVADFPYNDNTGGVSLDVTPMTSAVPEPSTWAMLMVGFLGLVGLANRRKSRSQLA
ncbi:PEPxxWA-CTERM sorting domain-containing protein [Bradyrhizobium guangdongense]|uniref:Ice-binding protein C-terminal domain-containing protein n=1 Tax=Bradyrhizobium guangdongense TaxID=1325090 RepID=A0A410V3V9_9BRAD|nr:PEPxxWA-CTERM sorting domain-containing protein [Bradyrhizobium guangdongense]QAU38355.1 hypothetical protein X265_12225 [Bradyrhizobium guangdongense]QOZ59410.1 hypothetical protein XH86_12225 [Bradyrhizobium guangdongense]GGI32890.1 hypothetical protein GCM10010987_71660 [Bradyrhizobium guangdongense]